MLLSWKTSIVDKFWKLIVYLYECFFLLYHLMTNKVVYISLRYDAQEKCFILDTVCLCKNNMTNNNINYKLI